jgi:hypothetical protein
MPLHLPKGPCMRSAEEQHPPSPDNGDDPQSHQPHGDGHEHTVIAHGSDQASSGRTNAFAGPFGLSEEALVRLEAGLRAQREQLLARPAQLTTVSGLCPSDHGSSPRA